MPWPSDLPAAGRRFGPSTSSAMTRTTTSSMGPMLGTCVLLLPLAKRWAAGLRGRRPATQVNHGVVVERVKVSVLEYVPVRRASVAPMACLNDIVTVSLLTGALQLVSTSGLALIAPKLAFGALTVVALACSGWGSAKAPLSSLPGLLELGSATERAASPALEMTLAVVEAR